MRFIIGALLLVFAPKILAAQDPAAVAESMRANTKTTDIVVLDRITRPAMDVRDGGIFEAAYDISGDRAANIQARVFAIRTLIWARMPTVPFSYEELTSDNCPIAYPGGFHITFRSGDVPMPADYDERIRMRVRSIATDSLAPEELINAAICLAGISEHPIVNYADTDPYTPIISNEWIGMEYVCGNKFLITNPLEVELDFQYEVVGTTEAGMIALPARTSGAPPTETVLETVAKGTVRLTLDEIVLEVENRGIACGS